MEGNEMTRSRSVVAGALVVLVLPMACGGGAKRLSKEDFIKTWDAICKRDTAKTDQIGSNLPATPAAENLPQFADALDQLVDVGRSEIDDLRAVKPPEQDQATIDGILSHLSDAIDAIERGQKAAADGDLAGFQTAVNEANTALQPANQAATDYGLKECGT
jgi:hypothetical protein